MTPKKNRNRIVRKSKLTTIEKFFRRAENINLQMEAKQEEILYWRELSVKTNAVFSQVSSGSARKNKSRVEECVCKIANIQESLDRDIYELFKVQNEITRLIDKVNIPRYKTLLTERYICGKTWYEIADSMGYSYVHLVNRMHPMALEEIKKNEIKKEIGDEV